MAKMQEISQKLGEPGKIVIGKDGESWFYTSMYTTLMVEFDNADTVSTYVYEKKSRD